jgi:hypothetical protein
MPRIQTVIPVDTLADLKARKGRSGQEQQQQVHLAGYYAPGDGGGGLFWWDATSTATPDDGLVVQVTSVSGAGRWRRIYSGRADVRWWGAIADGATNRHLRLQAALDSGVRHLYMPDNGSAFMYGGTVEISSGTTWDIDRTAAQKLDPSMAKGCVFVKNRTYFGTKVFLLGITGSPTGGTFTIQVNDQTTATIAYNATASAIQSVLEGLPNVGTGKATVSGSGGVYTVTFLGAVGVYRFDWVTVSLTGGTSPAVSVARTGGTADHDITVTGGDWDCSNLPGDYANAIGNSPGRGGGGLGAIQSYAGVDRITVSDMTARNSGFLVPSPIQFASCNDWLIERLHLVDGWQCDGPHINGPSKGGRIDGYTGRTFDDGMAIQAKDWTYGSIYHGCIEDVLIQNVNLSGCGNFIKFTLSADAPIKRVEIRNCRVNNSGSIIVNVYKDVDAYDASNTFTRGTITDLTINGLYATNVSYRILSFDHDVKGLRIEDMPLDGCTPSAQPLYVGPGVIVYDGDWDGLHTDSATGLGVVAWFSGATVKQFTFTGGRYDASGGGAAPLVYLDNAGTIEHLILQGMVINAPSGKVLQFLAGTTVNDVALVGCTATQTTSGNPAIVEAAGRMDDCRIIGGHYTGGQAIVRTPATPTPTTNVVIESATIEAAQHVVINSGGTTVLRLVGNRIDRLAGGGVMTNYPSAGTSSVISASNDFSTSVATGGVAVAKPGGGTVRWQGADIAQDLTLLTPQQWDTAKSLVAATGPAMFKDGVWNPWGHT